MTTVVNQTDSIAAYRRNSILTAGPMELIIMMFDGLRKDLMLSKSAIERNQIETAHARLMNAQAIITELINSLDLKNSMSHDILPIYDFMFNELIAINTNKNVEQIEPLLELVTEWREIWQSVADATRSDTD